MILIKPAFQRQPNLEPRMEENLGQSEPSKIFSRSCPLNLVFSENNSQVWRWIPSSLPLVQNGIFFEQIPSTEEILTSLAQKPQPVPVVRLFEKVHSPPVTMFCIFGVFFLAVFGCLYEFWSVIVEKLKLEDLEVTMNVEIEKSLIFNQGLSWNWHKSWNLPTISIFLEVSSPL